MRAQKILPVLRDKCAGNVCRLDDGELGIVPSFGWLVRLVDRPRTCRNSLSGRADHHLG